MSNALDRLSKIVDTGTFCNWYDGKYFNDMISDIQEVVALAKKSQQPNIDSMRFEAAKAAMQGYISHYGFFGEFNAEKANKLAKVADILIAELQKNKP